MRSHVKAAAAGSTEGASRRLIGLTALLVLVVMAMLCAGSALANTSYKGVGEFGNGTLGDEPTRIAVNDSTEEVLVADSNNNRVLVYAPSGTSASLLTEFGVGELSAPYGIAVDQSNGDVYVTDPGNSRIVRYESDGAEPPTYTLDAGYTSPAQGSAAGQVGSFASPIAIDPTNGDLLVADTGNLRVSRFTSAGAFVSSFNGGDSASGAFSSLLDLTVAGDGGIAVVANGVVEEVLGVVSGSVVQRFGSDGAAVGSPLGGGSLGSARSVAIGATASDLLVGTGGGAFGGGGPPIIHLFRNGTRINSAVYSGDLESAPVGLAASHGVTAQVYGLTAKNPFLGIPGIFVGAAAVQVFKQIFVPEVALTETTNVTSTSATLTGTVNSGGEPETHYHFEYLREGGSSWIETPDVEAGTGLDPEPVQAEISGLDPNSEYQVRLVASTPYITASPSPASFTTAVAPPVVLTDEAGDIAATSATLYGRVNPFGLLTTYYFEYGTTTAYGQRTSPSSPAGAGRVPRSFNQPIDGLEAGIVYHYRIVSSNSAGEGKGEDRTFTTKGSEETSRGYEMVSPLEKSGNPIEPKFGTQVAPNGGSVVYTTRGAFEEDSASAPAFPQYVAHRGITGWSRMHLSPPQLSPALMAPGFLLFRTTLAVSEDLSHSVVMSTQSLAPGGVDGGSNLYLEDNHTGELRLIGATPSKALYAEQGEYTANALNGLGFLVGGTSDFSTVVFTSIAALTPDAPEGVRSAYEWSEGTLTLVSKDASGDSIPNAAAGSSSQRRKNMVSADGSHVYFDTIAGAGGVYLHIDGLGTEPVSVSHRAGDDPTVVLPALFQGASRDGRYVFLETVPLLDGGGIIPPLTEDAPSDLRSIYRFDSVTGSLELVAQDTNNVIGQSDDGQYVYLVAKVNGVMQPQLWHDGTLTPTGRTVFNGVVSPSGRFLVFKEDSNIYIYDASTSAISCVSCQPAGVPSLGQAQMGAEETYFGEPPSPLLDNGTVFFETPNALVSRDTNGVTDVYEYRDGQAHLVSSGNGQFSAAINGVSPDGRDVFIATRARLVARDTDDLFDLYDARVGGGIPAQNEVLQKACEAEDCRGPGAAPAAPPAIGSSGVSGAGNQVRRSRRCSSGRHRVAAKAQKAKAKSRCGRNKTHSKAPGRRQGR